MADFSFNIRANDDASAQITAIETRLKELQKQLQQVGQSGLGLGAIQQATRVIQTDIDAATQSLQELKAQVAATASAFETLAEQAKVFYNNVNSSTLKAAGAELQNQLDIMRQLGSTASQYGSESSAQLSTRLAVLKAQSDEMRRLGQEEEKAGQARQKFASQISPQSNVKQHADDVRNAIVAQQRLNEEQSKFIQLLAPQSNIAEHVENVRRATQEQERLNREQAKFASQIAPKSNLAQHIQEIQRAKTEQEKLNAEQFKFQQQMAAQVNLADRQRQIEAEAAARKRATDQMVADLKRYGAEQDKLAKEQFKFQEQMAARTQVKFVRDDAGQLKVHPVTGHGMTEELDAATGASFNLGRSLQHTTAIFDGLMRGQRGQVVASFTALARDSGILENTLTKLTGVWGVYAAAAVAAIAVVVYALEQAYQRFKSVRETETTGAIQGFGFGPQQRAGAEAEFDRSKRSTNEYAGTTKELLSELDKLPPAAHAIRQSFDEAAKGYAGLQRVEPTKAIEPFVNAAKGGAVSLAEFITKFRGLEGVVDSSGRSLVELAKIAKTDEEAFRLLAPYLIDPKLKELGTAGRTAGNDMFWLAFGAGAAGSEFSTFNPLAEELAKTFEKYMDPLKGDSEATQRLTEDIKAQGLAIVAGNDALNKRIVLVNMMTAAQSAAERLKGTPAEERARSAAGTLEAEVRSMPQDPAEERRHRLALGHIHAEAQARHVDLQAQLAAAINVAREQQRTETQRLVGGGMDPERAAEMAQESEAAIKANNEIKEVMRRIQNEETAITIAGIQERIAAEAHGSKEKIALQAEIVSLTEQQLKKGQATQVQVETAKRAQTAFAREANREEYAEAAKGYENQIRTGKGSYDAITAIIAEWRANAAAHFKAGSVDFLRAMEDIERAGILAYRTVVEAAVSSANDLKQANRDILSAFELQNKAKLRDMGHAGLAAAPAAIEQERALAMMQLRAEAEAFNKAMQDADKTNADITVKTKIWWDLWRVGVEYQRQSAGYDAQIAEAQKRIVEDTKNTQIAQLKLSEAIAKSRGDLEEIVRLRIQEAQITAGDKYATPAQKINAQTDIVNALSEEQNRRFSELDRFNSSQERLDRIRMQQEKYRLQAQVADHSMSKETMATKEAAFSSKVMEEEEKRIEAQTRISGLTDQQKEKLFSHLAELYEKDAELQIAAQARVSEAIEKENEKRAKLLKGAFDEVGSGLEKSLTGLLTGEAGTNTLQDLRKSITGALVKETFSLGSQYLGSKLAPMLGVKTEGLADTGLGTVLSRALGNMLGLTKDTPKDAMQGAAEKIQKAADAQNEATKLIKPAADGLKEAGDRLKEAADKLKGGAVPSTTVPGGPTSSVPTNTPELQKLNAMLAEANKNLPAGYTARITNDVRPGATTWKGTPSEHGFARAADVEVLDPEGKRVPGYMGRGGPMYRKLDEEMIKARDKLYPGQPLAVGSTFSDKPDAGHYSIGGAEAAQNELRRLGSAASTAASALAAIKAPGAGPTASPPAPTSVPTPAYALGGPVGTDTVLAWLTPGERVLTRNQRAKYDRMFPSGIERHQEGGIAGGENLTIGGMTYDTPELLKLHFLMDSANENLPRGFSTKITSANRPGSTVKGTGEPSEHGMGRAFDVGIFDAKGNLVPGMMGRGGPLYRKLDEEMLKARDRYYPGQSIAIGSTFGTPDAGHYSMGGTEAELNEMKRYRRILAERGQRFADGGLVEEIYKQNLEGEFLKYKPEPVPSLKDIGKSLIGYTDIEQSILAARRGEYLQAFGQGVVGAATGVSTLFPVARAGIGAIRAGVPIAREMAAAVPSMLADESGALKFQKLKFINPESQTVRGIEYRHMEFGAFAEGERKPVMEGDLYRKSSEKFRGIHIGLASSPLPSVNPELPGQTFAAGYGRGALGGQFIRDTFRRMFQMTGETTDLYGFRVSGGREFAGKPAEASIARESVLRGEKFDVVSMGRNGMQHHEGLTLREALKFRDLDPMAQLFPSGSMPKFADGGIVASHPGLTSLTNESRGFAPYHLVQTNPGLGKGWFWLALLGGLAVAGGIASLFGEKDKDKALAKKLLDTKDFGAEDVTQITTPLTQEQLDKYKDKAANINPYTGKTIGDKDEPSKSWWEKILPKFHGGGQVPHDMAAFLQGGEVVLPRGYAEGGVVSEITPGSPTYSPVAGGAIGTNTAVRQLTENVSNVSTKMGDLATDVTKVTGALGSMARTTGSSENGVAKLSTSMSTISGAFGGLKSIFSMFGDNKSDSGGGGGGGLLDTAGSIFGTIGKILPIFMLEQGGIIPSAEGGMIMGGGANLSRGGTLSILHPGEMVLPKHLSEAVQDGANGGGPAGMPPPPINFHINAIDQRSGAQFLMNHRDTIAGLYRNAYRNFNPNLPG
jgi:hypothetical protein